MPIEPRDMENTTGGTRDGSTPAGDLSMPDHTPGLGDTIGGAPAPLPDTPDVQGELEEESRTGRQIEDTFQPGSE
ncbi:hypothetical protein [Deinococcus roseus]|uniref:M-like protein n=1 Tax=Deinococcus roseus TaxID=392414 RepID=A0ABQ2CWJ9_9DEIO|nr:hypothetical protein [Deinococcus roseus]GGJ27762.1 hypothetical protein GCM10008938_12280 [Deinococcus roseus]